MLAGIAFRPFLPICRAAALHDRALRRERIAITAAIVIPALFYLGGLGFYSDDWAFLHQIAQSADPSWSGLYGALAATANLAVRPPQILLYIAYHKAMPGSVIGPHLVNHAMLLATALILHDGLRRVPALRPLALMLVLAWIGLPLFTAQRMWFANHMSTLAMLMFALAVRLLAPVATGRAALGPARALAVALAALIGALSYILLAFTLVAMPLFLWTVQGLAVRRMVPPRDPQARACLAATALVLVPLVATCLFQLHVGGELLPSRGATGFAVRAAGIYVRAAITNFGDLGVLLPVQAMRMELGPFGHGPGLAAGTLTAGFAAWALCGRLPVPAGDCPSPSTSPRLLALAGLGAFALGLVGFLPVGTYENGPFGIGNRDNVAAALGVALVLVAAVQALAPRWPRAALALFLLWIGSGALMIADSGRNWAAAAAEQDRLFARITAALPALPRDATVLVQGMCPYHGAVPTFNARWGLADRLALATGDDSLGADTVRPVTQVLPEGISIGTRAFANTYPYGRLFVVNVATGASARLPTRRAATAWFARHPARLPPGCTYYGTGGVDPRG